MSVSLRKYTQEDESVWDSWCRSSINATFLHTRKFINYHGEKFNDLSLLIYDDETLVGVFPAAQCPMEKTMIVSHPGLTYGGIVHNGWLTGERVIDCFGLIKKFYANMGFKKLQYKAIPYIYSAVPSQDDLYALFYHSAHRIRCDLSSTINLQARRPLNERRKRSLKKALKNVQVLQGSGFLEDFWSILLSNLLNRHQMNPVHSYREIEYLCKIFPEEIKLYVAKIDCKVEAGVLLFNSKNVWHAQYIASSTTANKVSALDAIFENVIKDASNQGISYYDFGTCNTEHGRVLNGGLFRFKTEFGGGGVVYEQYLLQL